jgi:hypothetical protein
MAARGERTEGTGSGRGDVGPWARSGRGLERLPGVRFHIFPFFTSFSFFVFLILSQILQKCSKSIQTTFRDFTKITARF